MLKVQPGAEETEGEARISEDEVAEADALTEGPTRLPVNLFQYAVLQLRRLRSYGCHMHRMTVASAVEALHIGKG